MPERATAAWISRMNGAWLITLNETTAGDGYSVPNDLFTCASSLIVAKRVAVEDARKLGWEGRPRWTQDSDRHWTLEMREPEDEE